MNSERAQTIVCGQALYFLRLPLLCVSGAPVHWCLPLKGELNKVLYGLGLRLRLRLRLCPEVQPQYHFIYHFGQKR